MTITDSDLTVNGKNDFYGKSQTIRCFKVISEGDKNNPRRSRIPCSFVPARKEFTTVDYPPLKTPLLPRQESVLTEMRDKLAQYQEGQCKTLFGHIYTGFGKTILFLSLAIELKVPIIIFVDSDVVRTGWKETIQDELNITPYIPSGPILEAHNICIMSIQTARTHKYGFKAYSHYGVAIIDEADRYCTQLAVDELLDLRPKLLIGTSATVTRPDGLDKILDIFWGKRNNWVVRLQDYKINSKDVTLHMVYTSHDVETLQGRTNKPDWQAMQANVAAIPERNESIKNLCIAHARDKILVLCKGIQHVQELVTLLCDSGMDAAPYFGNIKEYYDAHILVATLPKAGRGYDDARVSKEFSGIRFNLLICTCTMKDADQAFGRALRGDATRIYLFVDRNSIMMNHARAIKSVQQKRGAKIVEEFI